ncbi:hypothetical protein ACQCVP_17865 [Rossellomorea vietnamensis]
MKQGEMMVLLDEKVMEVIVSESKGAGDINEEALLKIEDNEGIKAVESAIRTAVKSNSGGTSAAPDYDLVVSYGEDFPPHAIHVWLGEEGEQSRLSYMVGEGEIYTTTKKAASELRDILPIKQ